MNRKQLVKALKSMGITKAISSNRATVNGQTAVLLRWKGDEAYFTRLDIPRDADEEHRWNAWRDSELR